MDQKTIDRLRRSREAKKLLTGHCSGPKFFGEVEPTLYLERLCVTRIKQLRRKEPGHRQLGYGVVARILNEEGWVTKKGLMWTKEAVRSVIVGPVYRALDGRCKVMRWSGKVK